ncbi:hypothetical protein ACHAW6_008813 [Cyclotella cf. meneghiniana]
MDDSTETLNIDSLLFRIPDRKMAVGDSAYETLPKKVTVKGRVILKKPLCLLIGLKTGKDLGIVQHGFCHGKNTKDKMELHKAAVEACY